MSGALLAMLPAGLRRALLWAGGVLAGAALLLHLGARISTLRGRAREAERRVDTINQAREIERDVRTTPDDDLDRRLGRWMRP